MEIGERLKTLRKTLDMNQADFAKMIGFKQAAIGLWENGQRSISESAIKLICREFDISEDWLRTGEGKMFIEKPDDEILADYAAKITKGDDDFIRNLIKNYMELSEEHKQIIRKLFDK